MVSVPSDGAVMRSGVPSRSSHCAAVSARSGVAESSCRLATRSKVRLVAVLVSPTARGPRSMVLPLTTWPSVSAPTLWVLLTSPRRLVVGAVSVLSEPPMSIVSTLVVAPAPVVVMLRLLVRSLPFVVMLKRSPWALGSTKRTSVTEPAPVHFTVTGVPSASWKVYGTLVFVRVLSSPAARFGSLIVPPLSSSSVPALMRRSGTVIEVAFKSAESFPSLTTVTSVGPPRTLL